jgi:hypothetical protein
MYFSGERQNPGVNTAIVRTLASHNDPISSGVIASKIGRSVPTVQSHLIKLSERGIVQFAGDKATLKPGMR